MTKKRAVSDFYVTPAGGNIFADLGFGEDEATRLLVEAKTVVAPKLAIKAQLMSEINQWMVVQELKQEKAAEILNVSRPRVSDVVNKKTQKFTIDALVDMVTRTGKLVQLAVR
jgi:predicted XRE-type DNA-binding protein